MSNLELVLTLLPRGLEKIGGAGKACFTVALSPKMRGLPQPTPIEKLPLLYYWPLVGEALAAHLPEWAQLEWVDAGGGVHRRPVEQIPVQSSLPGKHKPSPPSRTPIPPTGPVLSALDLWTALFPSGNGADVPGISVRNFATDRYATRMEVITPAETPARQALRAGKDTVESVHLENLVSRVLSRYQVLGSMADGIEWFERNKSMLWNTPWDGGLDAWANTLQIAEAALGLNLETEGAWGLTAQEVFQLRRLFESGKNGKITSDEKPQSGGGQSPYAGPAKPGGGAAGGAPMAEFHERWSALSEHPGLLKATKWVFEGCAGIDAWPHSSGIIRAGLVVADDFKLTDKLTEWLGNDSRCGAFLQAFKSDQTSLKWVHMRTVCNFDPLSPPDMFGSSRSWAGFRASSRAEADAKESSIEPLKAGFLVLQGRYSLAQIDVLGAASHQFVDQPVDQVYIPVLQEMPTLRSSGIALLRHPTQDDGGPARNQADVFKHAFEHAASLEELSAQGIFDVYAEDITRSHSVSIRAQGNPEWLSLGRRQVKVSCPAGEMDFPNEVSGVALSNSAFLHPVEGWLIWKCSVPFLLAKPGDPGAKVVAVVNSAFGAVLFFGTTPSEDQPPGVTPLGQAPLGGYLSVAGRLHLPDPASGTNYHWMDGATFQTTATGRIGAISAGTFDGDHMSLQFVVPPLTPKDDRRPVAISADDPGNSGKPLGNDTAIFTTSGAQAKLGDLVAASGSGPGTTAAGVLIAGEPQFHANATDASLVTSILGTLQTGATKAQNTLSLTATNLPDWWNVHIHVTDETIFSLGHPGASTKDLVSGAQYAVEVRADPNTHRLQAVNVRGPSKNDSIALVELDSALPDEETFAFRSLGAGDNAPLIPLRRASGFQMFDEKGQRLPRVTPPADSPLIIAYTANELVGATLLPRKAPDIFTLPVRIVGVAGNYLRFKLRQPPTDSLPLGITFLQDDGTSTLIFSLPLADNWKSPADLQVLVESTLSEHSPHPWLRAMREASLEIAFPPGSKQLTILAANALAEGIIRLDGDDLNFHFDPSGPPIFTKLSKVDAILPSEERLAAGVRRVLSVRAEPNGFSFPQSQLPTNALHAGPVTVASPDDRTLTLQLGFDFLRRKSQFGTIHFRDSLPTSLTSNNSNYPNWVMVNTTETIRSSPSRLEVLEKELVGLYVARLSLLGTDTQAGVFRCSAGSTTADGQQLLPVDHFFAFTGNGATDPLPDDNRNYHKLHPFLQDQGYFSVPATLEPVETPLPKDFVIQGAKTIAAPEQLLVSEKICEWNGWSLALPRPGKTAVPVSDQIGTVGLHLLPVARSLPKLRYGRTYEMCLRGVDLAGFVCPLGKTNPPPECILALGQMPDGAGEKFPLPPGHPYLRFDIVQPPIVRVTPTPAMLLPKRNADWTGSTADTLPVEQTLVLKSDDLAAISADINIFPPNGDYLTAEYAGALGAFRKSDPQHFYDALVTRDPKCNNGGAYFPDPFARGVSIFVRNFPIVRLGTDGYYEYRYVPLGLGKVHPSAYLDGQTHVFYSSGTQPGSLKAVWPNFKNVTLKFVATKTSDRTSIRRSDLGIVIEIPMGEVVTLEIRSLLAEEDLDNMGIWQLLNSAADNRKQLAIEQVRTNRHDMLTPPALLRVIHATPAPLAPPHNPQIGPVAPRPCKGTVQELLISVEVHSPSTGYANVLAWKEPFLDSADESSMPLPVVPSGRIGEFFSGSSDDLEKIRATYESKEKASWLQKERVAEHQVEEVEGAAPLYISYRCRHDLQEAKRFCVYYWLEGATRFTEYFEKRDLKTWEVPSAGIRREIPSSKSPDSPEVAFIMPAFEWLRSGDNQLQSSVRVGGRLRIYLRRPWFSSGKDEKLAILLAENHTGSDSSGSAWGYDPIWEANNARIPRLKPLSATDFFGARVIHGLHLPKDDCGDSTAPRVVAAVLPVKFSLERRLWYCDVVIHEPERYMPFVQLVLSRYQEKSLPGLELSSPVTAYFMQLQPGRAATLQKLDGPATRFELTVAGSFGEGLLGAESRRVTVELQTRPVGASELRWSRAHLLAESPAGLSDGEVDLRPDDFGLHRTYRTVISTDLQFNGQLEARLLVREYEVLLNDQGGRSPRVVYADQLLLTSMLPFSH